MTLRKIAIYAVVVPVMAGMFSCNSTDPIFSVSGSSAAIRSFSLAEDNKVLANLDSVFFSIDMLNGLIFNADSLPAGTDVTRLVPVITTLENASAVELRVKKANGVDTTYNYLTNSTDSIDFTNPVTLRVVSLDGLNEFNYTVKVNVHKMVSDSLQWNPGYATTLPTTISNPDAQRTAVSNGIYYCLTSGGGKHCMATYKPSETVSNAPQMQLSEWTVSDATFPFEPMTESFTATDSALYILADDGTLYSSADGGSSWSATAMKWNSVYGRYADCVFGSVENADGWFVQMYPSGDMMPVPEGMPVTGASMPVSYTFPMSGAEQMVITGGRTADGTLTADTWGFDGRTWAKISVRPLPVALEGIAVASYLSFKIGTAFQVTSYPTLIAFGGRDSAGKVSGTVYVSDDFGCNWRKASALMQLPSYITPSYGLQAFVTDSRYSSTVTPKIVKPTETWECPYVYLFGGYDQNGTFVDAIWKGAINRLTFKPIE